VLIGKNASSGLCIGPAFINLNQQINIEFDIAINIEREIERFTFGIEQSKKQLQILREKVLSEVGSDKAQIFEAHLLILEDPELIDAVLLKIKSENHRATKAVHEVSQMFISMFENMGDEYLRERALDIKDVSERILKNILGIALNSFESLNSPSILVAHDITPSQMATLDLKNVLGIITEVGGKTSHTAIMARTLGIPAVVGLKDATLKIIMGETLICDGELGHVIPNPDQDTLQKYQKKKELEDKNKFELNKLIGLPSKTIDHHQVYLEANIASAADLESVLKNDAEGIGLFRTEFIFMDRSSAPSEEEQFEIYKKVLETMGKKPTVIRTLDIGGDKNISYLKIPKEENPFLGFRALRYCLVNIELFKTQLRALLRASSFGNLHIMFPMVTNLDEVLKAKSILLDVKNELISLGTHVSDDIKIGIMIEIPSAALITDILCKHVDFFSIGTNDLIQYLCAVDRMNESIHDLYDPFHPSVLRIINHVIKEATKHNIPVAMCGEMAANEALSTVLLGMGLSHFSMAPSSILKLRKKIRENNFSDSQRLADQILQLPSAQEIKNLIKNWSPEKI
jgi:phosphoenolpyruvate-protein phosphotransferase (PTS system enzyme I)